jgi:2-polyprenyl-3-methyl-5-hydroxy-6-metoxy-1,4-benzoquinol methylase
MESGDRQMTVVDRGRMSRADSTFYAEKAAGYFEGGRHDIVALLAPNPGQAILELGCGSGGTARAARAANKAGRYVGIELMADAAKLAEGAIDQVIIGDVESLQLGPLAGQFDVLIVSEVLEHLVDPWTTVRRLVACLKPGAAVFASSPNLAHWRVLRDLFLGRFDYSEMGVMDRTHLRWFTPDSYRAMFEAAGVEVKSVGPVHPLGWKARAIGAASGGRLTHLFMTQIMIVGCKR